MKKFWYKTVRLFVHLGLHAFFKKIKAVELEKLPTNTPYLFVANHRNGLIDPILIAITKKSIIFHFLTRASAFKNRIADVLLRSINMLPIYRIRDGKNSVQQNQEIFEACYTVFDKKESVLMFPEGNHGLPRRVRPLRKGFTRIALGYLKKNPTKKLKIVPVGINYSNMHRIGSSVSIYYGKPIDTNDYFRMEDEKEAVDQLKTRVANQLKQLTTHIDDLNQHDQIERALAAEGIDFLDPFKSNTRLKTKHKSDDDLVPSNKKKSVVQGMLYLMFSLNTFIPIVIWKLNKAKIKDEVLKNTFKFAMSIALIPLFYLLQAIFIGLFINYKYAIAYLLVSLFVLYAYKNTLYSTSHSNT